MPHTATVLLIFGALGILSALIPKIGNAGPLITCIVMIAVGLLLLDSEQHILISILTQLGK